MAQRVLREAEGLRDEIATWQSLIQRADDLLELATLNEESDDSDMTAGLDDELAALTTDYGRLRTSLMFSGDYDPNDAILTITAGAGGTEATDWAEMLLRMYLRWAQRHRFYDRDPGPARGRGGRPQECHCQHRRPLRLRPSACRARRPPLGQDQPL